MADVVADYRRAAELRADGLSEERIGVRMGLGQWTVSRLLSLQKVDADVLRVFEGDGVVSLSALIHLSAFPADTQAGCLGAFRKIVKRRRGNVVRWEHLAPEVYRHCRELALAPFPTACCRKCTARTGVRADLWGEVKPGELGRCLKSACWSRMMNAVKARAARWPKNLPAKAGNAKTKRSKK